MLDVTYLIKGAKSYFVLVETEPNLSIFLSDEIIKAHRMYIWY